MLAFALPPSDWIETHQGLWGILGLVVTLLVAVPGIIQFVTWLRDRNASADDLSAALRESRGRVGGPRLQNAAIGTREVLPMRLRTEEGLIQDATELSMSILRTGDSIVVLGEGGSGKSELLHQLHLDSYRNTVPGDPLIEVVSLAAYSDPRLRQPHVVDWAISQIAARYRRSRQAMHTLAAESRLVLAFDALDEAHADSRSVIADQLARWSRDHPMILTSRTLNSGDEAASPLSRFAQDGRVVKTQIEALNRADVVTALSSLPATDVAALKEVAESFSNPLRLQLLLFTSKQHPLDEEELREAVADPDYVLSRLIRGPNGARPSRDAALRLAAVVSADHEKDPGVAFRALPFQLAGVAFTITKLLTIPIVVFLGFAYGPVTATMLGIAVVAMSPYVYQAPLQRALVVTFPRLPLTVILFIQLGVVFALTHVVRVIIWSFETGEFHPGDWSDVLDWSWLFVAVLCWVFLIVPPLSLSGGVFTYGRYLKRHAWPQFAFAGALIAALAFLPIANVGVIGIALYFVTTCIYLTVSAAVAWAASGVAPWRWKSVLGDLVHRGVISREGRLHKFVHADIEQHLLWVLAGDSGPRSLVWRVYGLHWTDRMLSRSLGSIGLRTNAATQQVLTLLGRRFAWSPTVEHSLVSYLQWIEVAPARALDIARRCARAMLGRRRDFWLVDALDRASDPRGIERALRYLRSGPRSDMEAVWLLHVAERHLDEIDMLELIAEAEQHTPSQNSAAIRALAQWGNFLRRWPLTGSDSPTSEELAELADRLAADAGSNALRLARLAQAAQLRGEVDDARQLSLRAVNSVLAAEGYDSMVEIALTAAVLAAEPFSRGWLEKAIATGIRYDDRTWLRQRIGSEKYDIVFTLPHPAGGRSLRDEDSEVDNAPS